MALRYMYYLSLSNKYIQFVRFQGLVDVHLKLRLTFWAEMQERIEECLLSDGNFNFQESEETKIDHAAELHRDTAKNPCVKLTQNLRKEMRSQ